MTCAARTAMQIAVFCRTGRTIPAGRTWCGLDSGRDAPENRIERCDDFTLSAYHQAVAAFKPKNPAARAAIDVMDVLRLERFGSQDIVAVIGIAAINDDISSLETQGQFFDKLAGHSGGKHEPDCARFG